MNNTAKLSPYEGALSRDNSCYAAYRHGKLVLPFESERLAPALCTFVHNQFRTLVLESNFVCVGAKAAFNHGTYRFGMYARMGSVPTTAGLCRDLYSFVDEQDDMADEKHFTTFVACFAAPHPVDERDFERCVWDQLQALHEADTTNCKWDPTVSSNPEDPLFSFSFAERAFFIVGLNPASSRHTRRFAWPTLVFNAHYQFEQLRRTGRFARFQQVIRNNDSILQGDINPNLRDFGEASEATQYSGRSVEQGWKCPLHVRKNVGTAA